MCVCVCVCDALVVVNRRVNQVRMCACRPELVGMVKKVSHLVRVETESEYTARLERRLKEMHLRPELIAVHKVDVAEEGVKTADSSTAGEKKKGSSPRRSGKQIQ